MIKDGEFREDQTVVHLGHGSVVIGVASKDGEDAAVFISEVDKPKSPGDDFLGNVEKLEDNREIVLYFETEESLETIEVLRDKLDYIEEQMKEPSLWDKTKGFLEHKKEELFN